MTFKNTTPKEAYAALSNSQGKSVYLDVRTPAEFAAGHPINAVNIPVVLPNPQTGQMQANPDFLTRVEAELSADVELFIGCKSGGRSMTACQILQNAGRTNVINVAGGFEGSPTQLGWIQCDLPVQK